MSSTLSAYDLRRLMDLIDGSKPPALPISTEFVLIKANLDLLDDLLAIHSTLNPSDMSTSDGMITNYVEVIRKA